jgi:hypothetical protein
LRRLRLQQPLLLRWDRCCQRSGVLPAPLLLLLLGLLPLLQGLLTVGSSAACWQHRLILEALLHQQLLLLHHHAGWHPQH